MNSRRRDAAAWTAPPGAGGGRRGAPLRRPEGSPSADPELAPLRYQLFSGVAGTLATAQAHGAEQAVFAVQAYRTPLTDDRRLATNDADLRRFLVTALYAADEADRTAPVGPLAVAGGGKVPGELPLWIATVRTEA